MRDQRLGIKKQPIELEVTKISKPRVLPKRRKVKFKNQFLDVNDDGYYLGYPT